MTDTKIRLSIVTALNSAGLKATKEQIDGLTQALTKVNKAGSTGLDGVSGKLQKMPGLLGDITGSFGKIGGAIGYAYVAWETFTKGLSVGNELFKKFGDGAGYSIESIKNGFSTLWDDIKNGWDKLTTGTNAREAAAKANEIAKMNAEAAVKAAENASNRKIELMQKELAASQKVVDAVNRETQAYMSQAQALGGIKSAQGNAEVLMLERKKFEERLRYEASGYGEAADQIGLAYDVEIQRVKNRAALAQNGLQQREAEQQALSSAKIAQTLADKVDAAYAAVLSAQADVEELSGAKGNATNTARLKLRRKALEKAKAAYDAAQAEYGSAFESVYAKYGRLGELQQAGANLRMSGQMALEMAALGYDNWVTEHGNAGNFIFDKDYVESLNRTSETIKFAEETAGNTRNLATLLEQLLRVKE